MQIISPTLELMKVSVFNAPPIKQTISLHPKGGGSGGGSGGTGRLGGG